MSDENITKSSAEETPGDRLKAARKAKGLTLEEVSETLHILPSNLRAIEDNRFDQVLKGATFVRGYLRRYGEHLGLEGESLVAQYNEHFAAPETKTAKSGVKRAARSWRARPLGGMTTSRPRRAISAVWRGLVLVVFVAAAAGMVLQLGWFDDHGATSSAPSTSTGPALLTLPAEQPVPELVDPDSEATRDEGTAEMVSDQDITRAPGNADEVVKDEASLTTDMASESLLDSLRFELTGDSWIEVRDASGNRLYADLVRAGGQVDLEGNAPFSIIVGDGRGVSISYNGRLLNYSYARNGYAEFTVP